MCLKIAAAWTCFATSVALLGQVTVPTNLNDARRSGANLNETVLNTSNVSVNSFGKLFSRAVDGQIYAQPLYISSVTVPGQGVHNVVYIATEHDSVYAYDADNPGASTPLWHVSLGPSVPASVINATSNLIPEIGISGTPVIDPSSGTLYVVAETYEASSVIFRLHALDITNGAEKFGGPVVIQGSVPGTGAGSSNGVLAFNPTQQWQRPGLLLSNANVYIAFGSHLDAAPFNGWILAYSASTLQQTAIRCVNPNGEGGGVWQGGVGLSADANGFVYAQTGNGAMDANSGGQDYGDSVVKLNAGLAVNDYFSPSNQSTLEGTDADFGSSGPLLIPGTSLGVSAGKDGKIFLWNQSNLGQFHATDQVVQEWQGTYSLLTDGDGGFFAGNVFYNSRLYAWGRRDVLKAYSFNGATFNTTPTQGLIALPDDYSNEPGMSVSANGSTAGTGILWAAYSNVAGGADGNPHPGILRAFDASNITAELWNSDQNQTRDYSGSWSKWCPPTIANGKVYLATFDNVLNVYGLLGSGSGGQLLGAGDSSAAALNLTAEGSLDWEHWGDGTLNRKAGVTALLSTYTVLNGTTGNYNNDPRPVSWTDGTPTASGTNNTNGVYTGQGFSFTAPAYTTTRTLMVHVGGWMSAGMLTAHLSDGSAPDYVDTTVAASGQFDRNYTLTYSAATAGATLTVTWRYTSGAGNITLNAAALSGPTTSIASSGGTPQSAVEGAAFATALQAVVKDSGGNPVSGVSVTFAAPGSGASGTFTGPATVTTNGSGIAVAPTFTANSVAGIYTATASAAGVSGTASFSLTNTSGTAASIASSGGTPQSAVEGAAFATALQAVVKDSGGNPVSGVSVTFAAPGSGASGTFTGSATVTTNGSGIAVAPTFTANSVAGSYTVTASAAGVSGTASFSLTNTSGVTSGGSLVGSGNSTATLVNLTTEGTVDWEHWGDGALNRKAGVTAQLSNYTVLSGTTGNYNNDPRPVSWTDGTPTASATNNTNGVYTGQGFSFTAPADTTARTLVVHVGGWKTGCTLTAHLSDGSAPDYVDTTVAASGQFDRNYTLTYNAATAGATLTVTWRYTSGAGNITLNAAALSGPTTSIASSGGTPQSAVEGAAFATALQAVVKDSGGNPVSGVSVTFAAPGSGASGTFTGPATVTTNGSGIAVAPTFTANSVAGIYTVTASAAGVSGTASFSLTNTSGTAASIASSGGTPQSAVEGAAFATALQAVVKDSGGNPVSGVSVTFAAPGSGASGTFTGPATVTTNGSGIAVAPTFTANSVAGSYTVTASAAGVSGTASFSLTNTSGTAASIASSGGTPQSAVEGAAFATALQAVVKDSGGNPVSGVSVTFAAPGSGASGTFTGSATVTTNGSGIAVAPTFTANSVAGSYTVTASAAGVSGTASFSLTNTSGTAASIASSGGTPQSAVEGAAFATALQAVVKDSGGNPVSGVSVTFAAPGSGASGTFTGPATVTTNGSGIAVAPTFTANSVAGSYTATASAAGVSGTASFSLTNTSGVTSGGSLLGSGNSTATLVNLTTEGTVDWEHWGDGTLNRKAGVTAQLSNYTVLSGTAGNYNNDPRPVNWTDGTPTASGTNNTNGVYTSLGFSFTAPADTTTRTLVVHVGGWKTGCTLTAHLSDGSAPDYVDTTVAASGQFDRNYTLTYNAATAGATLTVTWRYTSGAGNITLNAAALN